LGSWPWRVVPELARVSGWDSDLPGLPGKDVCGIAKNSASFYRKGSGVKLREWIVGEDLSPIAPILCSAVTGVS
jgi:hypothetical protein